MSDACRRQGMAFGIYLSPWDRNRPDYGRPEYVACFRNQLWELLSNYGPIFEVWFDGANGGDGYYGGARETRKIGEAYYGWPETWKLVRKLQPGAVIFSGVGPDVRWVGNESGQAGSPCWPTFGPDGGAIKRGDFKALVSGTRNGAFWRPAEADVSIRPGWFFHEAQDSKVKSAGRLTQIYFDSVGRGAALNLNIPPDRRGRINEADIQALESWASLMRRTFGTNLAQGSTVAASNTRGNSPLYSANHLVDGESGRYWATDDGVRSPSVVLGLGRRVTLNVVQLREYLPLGCRVDSFALDSWQNGAWKEFAKGTAIGSRCLIRTDPMTTDKVRLRITKAAACPALNGFGLYLLPSGGA
jgi:alpha-L-fucosidase